jgi:hypothetical protein
MQETIQNQTKQFVVNNVQYLQVRKGHATARRIIKWGMLSNGRNNNVGRGKEEWKKVHSEKEEGGGARSPISLWPAVLGGFI